MDTNKLETITLDQLKNFKKKDCGIIRDIDFKKYLRTKQITVISGIRRSGKSTLLTQFSQKFNKFYYINFDDERLVDFKVSDFADLMLVFKKMYSANVIFIDEIQNIPKWERFIRRIFDEGYKIFITGSNAKLLSSELATHLTGRYFKIDLYPFSFKEFLNFRKIDYLKKDTNTKSKILKNFDFYLKNGGFPEFIKYKDSEYLKRIYENVLYKDILTRFKIREVKSFKQLANFLFTNFTGEISYNSLKNLLKFKSVMSVKNYVHFMEESFLIFELYKYDFSLKKQLINQRKIYVIDNGIRNTIAFYFSQDKGKLLENLIFLELRRRGLEIYFSKNKYECDFLINDRGKIVEGIQVTDHIDDLNKEREIKGLQEALEKFKLKKGLIITKNQKETYKQDKFTINVVPAWEWLLRACK